MKNDSTPASVTSIISAAKSVFSRNGYHRSTIAVIAEEAGVSRGLLHYHFKNKDEILVSVIQHATAGMGKEFTHLLDRVTGIEECAEGLTSIFNRINTEEHEYFELLLEGWAASRQSPAILEEFKKLLTAFKEMFVQVLEKLKEKNLISKDVNVHNRALLLVAVFDGLALQAISADSAKEIEGLTKEITGAVRSIIEA